MSGGPEEKPAQTLENALAQMNAMILADIARTITSSSQGGAKNCHVFRRDGSNVCMVLRDTLAVEGAQRIHGPDTFAKCIAFVNEHALEKGAEAERRDAGEERGSPGK